VTAHPSYYALDGVRLGGPVSPPVAAHLAACAPCSAYLASEAGPAPSWLGRASVPAPARPRRRRWAWPALALAAAVLVLVARPRPEPIRDKGAPAVSVFVKRGEQVFLWDGERAVRPGDRLRLRVGGTTYRHVSVASLPSGGAPAVLYQGALGDDPLFLPLSFRVDERGHQERLSVIFGRDPVPPGLHRAETGAPAETWRQILTFDKESP
jgi:hypothetical protein